MYDFMNKKFGEKSFLSISSFPVLGTKEEYYHTTKLINGQYEDDEDFPVIKSFNKYPYNTPELIENNIFSQSKFINDFVICSHPRFGFLGKNIRTRRGKKPEILVPIFKDKCTSIEKTDDEPFPGFIYMDSNIFGMGNSCFQVTIGASTFNAAQYVYDQLIPLTPLLVKISFNLKIALSASSPIFKGKLSEYDARFNIISMSMDDRTDEEKDKYSPNYIYKSRYSPIYSYISNHEYIQDFHNDYPKMPIDKKILKTLIDNNIPERIATHFSNILLRDPLVIFDQKTNFEETDTSFFETFNSTNWNSLRFKPPRVQDNDNCFKIEIRPCDLQLTPFENAAMMTFCIIYSQMVLKKDVNFIIPITKVDKNFEKAHDFNAFECQLFSFRVDGLRNYKKESKLNENNYLSHGNPILKDYFYEDENAENIKELTLKQILCGCEEYEYEGLLNVMNDFVDERILNPEVKDVVKTHLNFLECRVRGNLIYIRINY